MIIIQLFAKVIMQISLSPFISIKSDQLQVHIIIFAHYSVFKITIYIGERNKISKYIYFRIFIPISFITMFYRNISQIFQTGIFAIIQLMKLRIVTNLPTTLYGMIMMCVHIVLRTLFIFTFIFFVCYFFFISFRENRVSETWLTEY